MDRVKPTFEKKEWQGDKQAIDNLVVSEDGGDGMTVQSSINMNVL
jgi:hypothetical protein